MKISTRNAIDNVAKLLYDKRKTLYLLSKHDGNLTATINLLFDEKICKALLTLVDRVRNDKDLENDRIVEDDKAIVDAIMGALNEKQSV
jgi:hypothetical protein